MWWIFCILYFMCIQEKYLESKGGTIEIVLALIIFFFAVIWLQRNKLYLWMNYKYEWCNNDMHFINVFSYLKERLKKVIAIEELNWHALMSAIHENIVRLRSVKWSNIVKNHVFWIRCIFYKTIVPNCFILVVLDNMNTLMSSKIIYTNTTFN